MKIISKAQPVDKPIGLFLKTGNWCKRAQPIVSGAISVLVALGTIRRQAEQAMEQARSSTPLRSLLPPDSYLDLSFCPDFL